eukprot:scaffold91_cov254-Pinguiococcus_pyrenoidosus.AAC.34
MPAKDASAALPASEACVAPKVRTSSAIGWQGPRVAPRVGKQLELAFPAGDTAASPFPPLASVTV